MKYCENCHMTILDHTNCCPLCQTPLIIKTEEKIETFPFIPTIYIQHHLFFKILMVISLIAGLSSIVVNFFLSRHGWWSLFVLGAIACIWISLVTAIRTRHNVARDLFYQVLLVSFLVVVWDILTGWHGWSISFVVPIAFSAVIVAMHILALVLKMRNENFIFYILASALFGIVPIIFSCFHLLITPYPSLICVIISIISFAVLLIFKGKAMKTELERRLHL